MTEVTPEDEEVAKQYLIYRKPYLTDEENDKLQEALRAQLIKMRIGFRNKMQERLEIWKKL